MARFATLLLAAILASQQQSVSARALHGRAVDEEIAVQVVSASSSNSTAPLFEAETLQLTDSALDALLESEDVDGIDATIFNFDDEDENSKRSLRKKCKTYPGDLLYPSRLVWSLFNVLIGGHLIKTTPYASVCYSDFGDRDEAACTEVSETWIGGPLGHTQHPTSVNAIFFGGNTCLPPNLALDSQESCEQGAYPDYAVEALNVAHIQLAVNLARNLNLRLVVKNTGHCFLGKSMGMGALSIWTHNLKDIRFIEDHSEGGFSGPAFKVGAGVQAFELYEAANKHGVTVVAGEGDTVGVMGGFILGGGHSPLSSIYGMASDHVLSMEVVTASGRFVTASETSNSDLFWALRGGGGATFGVVTSVTIKAFPKTKVALMSYLITTSAGTTEEAFWESFRAYLDTSVSLVKEGHYTYFTVAKVASAGDALFHRMQPYFAPGWTAKELEEFTKPMIDRMKAAGAVFEPVYSEFDNFHDAWEAGFLPENWGVPTARMTSRLFQQKNWCRGKQRKATFDAIRTVVEDGAAIQAIGLGPGEAKDWPDTAVNDAWRKTVLHTVVLNMWDKNAPEDVQKAESDKVTNSWGETLRKVTPGSGAYLNEADIIEPDFQQAFYGDKYARLRRIKRRWDPTGLFYAPTAVGSEDWEMSEKIFGNIPSQNSKLCRK